MQEPVEVAGLVNAMFRPSFEDLYAEQFLPMVRLATLMCGRSEVARDIVQDSFVRLHMRWSGVRHPKAYLRRSVVNGCRSRARWERRRRGRSSEIEPVPPDDPIVAEAEIRARHALAVDRTVPLSDDPPDLVDDTTGIEQATAEVDAGQYADAAASAEHTIGELVFTAPDEAWFEYSITTPLGELPGRHGVARFNGSVWQITRDTICQDLATAGGRCVPESLPNTPPEPEGWAERIADYERTANLYFEHQFCLPAPFGGGECVVEGGFAEYSVETSSGG